ncbi:hypothetical protein BJF93_06635 [Xaviernesmea oryzae]|uniref:Peptidoglycan binding-like domain-containing protein n=1 Tax=Xaviernesmea oryzae TaxID=464029 RepID=A0A1Q9AS76_9HYPH|nr:peptidoglycan-binding protein [Xaviernesmea oryzae]OLP58284.1 hypothetical protein BJF93_06635 [Xaviernesmea oryzae]SEL43518.1 localization factor PodJL [Xaviernesmea oryzae]
MNGSRSQQQTPNQEPGRRSSSFETLSRTIEGLEARIEGLMETARERARGPAGAPSHTLDRFSDDAPSRARTGEMALRQPDPRNRQDAADGPVTSARAEAIAEIIARQKALLSRGEAARQSRPATASQSIQSPSVHSRAATTQGAAPASPAPMRLDHAQHRQEPSRTAERRPRWRAPAQAEADSADIHRSPRTEAAPAASEIAQALVGLRHELKQEIADGLAREMQALRSEMRGLAAEAERDQTSARDIRADLQKLSDSVAALGRQAPAEDAADLRAEFDALRRMMDGLAREDSMRRIEGRWAGVEERILQSDSTRDDELVALAYRLDELKHQIAAAQSEPALHALEGKLSQVLEAVDRLAAQVAPTDRRLQGYIADLDRRLDDMRLQMGQLDSLGALEGLENRLGGVMDAVEAIAIQMPPNDRRLHASLGELDGRLSEMHAQLERLSARPDPSVLEARLLELVRAIEAAGPQADRRLQEQMAVLERRLAGLSEEIVSLDSVAALSAVESRLVTLAQAVDTLSRQVRPGDTAIQEQFSALDRRLDEITRAIVVGGRSATDAAAVSRVEARLGDLTRQIEAMPVQGSELAGRIEALTARMEELSREDAAARLETRLAQLSEMMERAEGERRHGGQAQELELTRHLTDISRKIDALENGAVNEDLANRLDGLSRRIEAMGLSGVGPSSENALSGLEERLARIAERIETAQSAPADDPGALAGLHAQIAGLSDLLRMPRTAAGLPEDIENRMNALEDYLSTSDEYIIEAARQAAEAVMDAYARGNGAPGTAGTDMAAIAALADDLKTLEDMSRSSQEQTARTFESLHETLVDIVGKLERLEQPAAAVRAPVAEAASAGRRDARIGEEPADALPVLAAMRDQDEREDAGHAGLISSLTRRLSGRKAETMPDRQMVEAAPSIDPAELLGWEAANEPLEPGSGGPDVKTILARVRAGQKARMPEAPAEAKTGDIPDFIAAARRAAQLAAEEVDGLTQEDGHEPARGGRFARHRKPILIAVGAILMALLAYPLVGALTGDEKSPVIIDAPAQAPKPAVTPMSAPAPTVDGPSSKPSDANAPGSKAIQTDQTQADAAPIQAIDTPSSQAGDPTAFVPEPDAPQASGPAASTPPGAALKAEQATGNEDVTESASMPVTMEAQSVAASASTVSAAPVTRVTTSAVRPAPSASAAIDVPAEIAPPALADAARAADPLAFFEIGAIYTDGRGVAPDLAKAALWYQRAADAGLAPALYRLGSLYEKGSGVSQDLAKAKTLYEVAAEKGNASAMHNLAVLIAGGRVGPPDFAAAAHWFQMAAERGVRDSQFNLAILYARGNGVSQDLKKSWKWFDAAAAQGDTDAAQKRDEVAKVIKPADLEIAKAEAAVWKPKALEASANEPSVPDAWLGKAQTTGAIDMKKAIRNIQAILNNNGFDAGRPDGEIGAKTVTAIKAFQSAIGQAPTGQITDQLVRELLKRNGQKA